MRLHAYVDHVPGDLINDIDKYSQVLSATLDELHRRGHVQFEEDRRGLHLKVLVDGCRTAEEAADFTMQQSWRTQYAVAATARDVNVLMKERDVAVRLAAAAIKSAVAVDSVDARCGDSPSVPLHSPLPLRLVSEGVMRAAGEGDVCTLRVLYSRLLRNVPATSAPSDDGNSGDDASPDTVFTHLYLPIVDKDSMTPTHRAAKYGHIDAMRALVDEFNMNINITDRHGKTPLHLASMNGHTDTVCTLVRECGADFSATDNYGCTPLHLTSWNGHIDAVRVLVQECGAYVNAKDNDGKAPLHLASVNGHTDAVRVLVKDCLAYVNIGDSHGRTPLHLASMNDHTDTVVTLVQECYADVNARGNNGKTPLHLASLNDRFRTVFTLVRGCQADVNARDSNMKTPLDLAFMNGCARTVKVFEDCLHKYGIRVYSSPSMFW